MVRFASTLAILTLFSTGCDLTKSVDCLDTPEEDVCMESCTNHPDSSFCDLPDDGCPANPNHPNCLAACRDSDGGYSWCGDVSDMGPCNGACAEGECEPSSESCVACLVDGDCEGGVCLVDEADPANNACVGCRDDSECTDPDAARCDAGTCAPCDDSAQCTEAGAGVCSAGSCVECDADDESACGSDVCDVAAQTCTDTPAGTTGLCQPCVSDRQCSPGRVCAPMTFEGTDLGHFCLWRQDATEGPAGSCLNTPPYAQIRADITTMSGDTATICSLGLTTCDALEDFRSVDCTEPGTAVDPDPLDECGVPGLDDGLCRTLDAVTNRCTIPCLSNEDCRTGATCNTGETPSYCNL